MVPKERLHSVDDVGDVEGLAFGVDNARQIGDDSG